MAGMTDDTGLKVLQLEVRGMQCVNCADSVERRLKGLTQVRQVNVDYPAGRAVVRHAGQLDIADLQKAMGDEGYTLSIIQRTRPDA